MVPGSDTRSDRALLAAHRAGERYAFDELVGRHRDRLWAVAIRTLGDREEAADALQDALLSAFRAAHAYRSEAGVGTWLHRIVVNACLDRLRRARLRPVTPLGEDDVPAARDPIADRLTRLTVQSALAELPVGQRLAVVLVDMQGFGVAEAAAVLGIRQGTVKSRCARGRARLAELLGPREAGASRPGGAEGGAVGPVRGNRTGPADVEPEDGSATPARAPSPRGDPTAPRGDRTASRAGRAVPPRAGREGGR